MIDLHLHSFLSDGVLIPSELVRRVRERGFKAVAITDHLDFSNIDLVVPNIVKVCERLSNADMTVLPGVEITHVPPEDIAELVGIVRKKGIKVVLVHGETIVEPVAPLTNRRAIEAGVDVLAHPGLISEEEVKLAKEKNVCLEITTRGGHSLTNGHVVQLALKVGAKLVIDSDSHSPSDLGSEEFFTKVGIGAGLSIDALKAVFKNSVTLVNKKLKA